MESPAGADATQRESQEFVTFAGRVIAVAGILDRRVSDHRVLVEPVEEPVREPEVAPA